MLLVTTGPGVDAAASGAACAGGAAGAGGVVRASGTDGAHVKGWGAGLLCGSGGVADVVGLAELLCGGVDDDLRAKFLRIRGMSTCCSVEQAKRGTSKLTTALKALSRLAS